MISKALCVLAVAVVCTQAQTFSLRDLFSDRRTYEADRYGEPERDRQDQVISRDCSVGRRNCINADRVTYDSRGRPRCCSANERMIVRRSTIGARYIQGGRSTSRDDNDDDSTCTCTAWRQSYNPPQDQDREIVEDLNEFVRSVENMVTRDFEPQIMSAFMNFQNTIQDNIEECRREIGEASRGNIRNRYRSCTNGLRSAMDSFESNVNETMATLERSYSIAVGAIGAPDASDSYSQRWMQLFRRIAEFMPFNPFDDDDEPVPNRRY